MFRNTFSYIFKFLIKSIVIPCEMKHLLLLILLGKWKMD